MAVSAICVGDWGTSAEGSTVERCRREDRGAEGAEGVGCAKGVSPSLLGEGPGEGAVPPPQKKCFDFLSQKGDFWCILGATFTVN